MDVYVCVYTQNEQLLVLMPWSGQVVGADPVKRSRLEHRRSGGAPLPPEAPWCLLGVQPYVILMMHQ